MQGDNYQVDKEPILDIPIYQTKDTKPFEVLVDKIIQLKQENKQTKKLEDEIDNMVYQLYGLDQDDINTIETNT
jgi:adenine-specific DNA-methyltransferase